MKFTVHVVQSFIKGHRKSGVISIKHSITNPLNVRFLPVTATPEYNYIWCTRTSVQAVVLCTVCMQYIRYSSVGLF